MDDVGGGLAGTRIDGFLFAAATEGEIGVTVAAGGCQNNVSRRRKLARRRMR